MSFYQIWLKKNTEYWIVIQNSVPGKWFTTENTQTEKQGLQ